MPDTPKSGAAGGGADFVKNIVKDPANVPDVTRLYGYAGASSEPGHERLYLNPDLSSYVEIPSDAILHRAAVPTSQDPRGAEELWVRQDADLKQKAAPAANALAHYFAGTLAGGAVAQPQAITLPVQCQPTIIAACHPTLGGCPPPPTNLCTHAPLCGGQPTLACTHPPQCYTPPPTPGCTHPPQCHQPTLPPFCPPLTLPPQCPLPTALCTHPPQCLPQTPACVTHNTPCLHTPLVACPPPPTPLCTHPPQCLPQTPVCVTHQTPCLHTPLIACPPPTPACVTHNTPCVHTVAACPVTVNLIACPATTNVQCHVTLPAVCQIVTHAACPVQSFPACPPPGGSIACGSIACGVTLGCGNGPIGGGQIG